MKHDGLGHDETTRSGLFMEQIRIVKEMREHDRANNVGRGRDVRPRYMVWENVPGAFSSNNGEDFRAVLEETARIAQADAVIPGPPKGKWATSGAIMGDGWSIAWRVLDAQFWGVPQRRRRIALVADFGGHTGPEILFVGTNNSRDASEEGRDKRDRYPHLVLRGGGCTLERLSITIFDGIRLRWLTPTEEERVAGYPDGWTDIGTYIDSNGKSKKSSDSARYKALGNSIALPPWKWIMKRISAQYERDATLGSLFDGIGGFPLIWERINGKGTARWASEIEEFPIAVTKLNFGEVGA